MKAEVPLPARVPASSCRVTKLGEVLSAEGIAAEIQEIIVPDAKTVEKLKFRGSPTIRIKRRDLAGKAQGSQSFALACRLYLGARGAGVRRRR
jgi:hypothetical protein